MPGARILLVLCLAARASASAADETKKPRRMAVIDKQLTLAVSRAVEDARDKLSGAECQKVLHDYRDRAGRTLDENLEAVGQTPAGYLGWMVFYDGDRQPFCRRSDVHAFTEPGSRIVYICQRQFRDRVQREAGLAGAYIIHELLHSLGLAENPPTPADITRQVVARCGR